MRIGNAAGTMGQQNSMQAGMMNGTDSTTRNIQNQIKREQQKLQELSKDTKMTPEAKMKKKQEITQQIAQLNQQLKQHQIEMRKEKQKENTSSMDDALGGNNSGKGAAEKAQAGMSASGMKALVSADSALKQADVQGAVASRQEGRAGVLAVEIKLDGERGGSTQRKQEELARVEASAQKAGSAQMETLGKAQEELKEAGKGEADQGNASAADNKTDSVKKETDPSKPNAAGKDEKQDEDSGVGPQGEAEAYLAGITYRPVDIRL